MSDVPNVYACIAAVSAEIAQAGISKTRTNVQQGYQFRGIDDVYNALAPILAKHHLVILPRMLSREQTERPSKSGGVLFTVVVEAEFDFVSALDGSKHTTRAYGEANDTADKATNKAMSAAYKYTAFQTFCIPTEGDHDADGQHHEAAAAPVAPPTPRVAPTRPIAAPAPSLTPPEQRSRAAGKGSELLISPAQGKRLYAIAKQAGWPDAELNDWLAGQGFARMGDIPRRRYDELVKMVAGGAA